MKKFSILLLIFAAGIILPAAPLRHNFTLVFKAEKGKEISFELESKNAGKQDRPIILKAVLHDDKVVELEALPINARQSYKLMPEADGLCTLPVATGGAVVTVHPGKNCRFAMHGGYDRSWKGDFIQLYRPPANTRLYFTVPAGVKEFQIEIGCNGPNTITIINGEGYEKVRLEEIQNKQFVSLKRENVEAETWAIIMEKCTHTGFRFLEPLSPVVAFNKNDLAVGK